MRIREYGTVIGEMKPGPLNRISDVPGVTVGHATIADQRHNTGVTVVMPCPDNPFVRKLPCASFVLNGFGKTAGLVQIDELGTLETPIALTNTLNVGLTHDALVEYMVRRCRAEGVPLRSVNPVVCECNDAALNDIQERAVRQEHVFQAIESASAEFAEGAVGCGRGMTCHGLKGGVGSASRIVKIDGKRYTLGVLCQCNHGALKDLTLDGRRVGPAIQRQLSEELPDKGSCIMILATDLPLSDRQLRRTLKRLSVGLARLGSYIGHGSGEVFIGFSTANRYDPEGDPRGVIPCEVLNEERMNQPFRAAAECAEEAVLNALCQAEEVTGPTGTVRYPLERFLEGCGI